jgi:lactoylglutathione lyase
MAQAQRPRILGVAHAGIYAHDIAAARTFYETFLGYGEPVTIKQADGSLSFAFVKVNERQYVELFPEREPGSDRLAHIALETDDAEGMRQYLASRGVTVPPQTRDGRVGNTNFTVKDPDGHNVEFVQYRPESLTSKAAGYYLGRDRISTRILHLGITVANLDAANRFYADILGCREFWRGSRDGKVLNWVNMRVPDGNDYVEFMLRSGKPDPATLGTDHHIALEVPDMAAALAALRPRAERTGYTRPMEIRTGINRKRQLNLFDADGTRVELMEPTTVDGRPAPSSNAPPPR